MQKRNFWIGVLLVLCSSVGFSSKAVIIKMLYLYKINTISVISMRMIFSLPIYVLVLIFLKRKDNIEQKPPISRADILKIGGLGILSYYVSSMLDFWGLKYVSAGVERLILFTYPSLVLVFGVLFYGRKITPPQYIAIFLTYLGVAIAFLAERGLGKSDNFALGGFLIFCCAFSYAFFVLFTAEVSKRVPTMQFTCYAMIAATIPTLIQSIFYDGMNIFNYSSAVYVLIFWMVVVATVMPTFTLVKGIQLVGASTASIVAFSGPISTLFLAYIFLNEPITPLQLIGTALILGGIGLVSFSDKK